MESIVFSCSFCKEINSDESFLVTEDSQNDNYWSLFQELFLYRKVSVLSLQGMSFWLMFIAVNRFSPFLDILTKTCFSLHITHFSANIIWFALINYQRFDGRSLFKPVASFGWPPFWIAGKQIFLRDLNRFCSKPIPNNAEFIFIEKNFLKYSFFQKKNSLFILCPSYI